MLLPDEALLLSLPHCSNQRLVKRNLDKNNFCRIFSRAFTFCKKLEGFSFIARQLKKQKSKHEGHVDLVNIMNNLLFSTWIPDQALDPRDEGWVHTEVRPIMVACQGKVFINFSKANFSNILSILSIITHLPGNLATSCLHSLKRSMF